MDFQLRLAVNANLVGEQIAKRAAVQQGGVHSRSHVDSGLAIKRRLSDFASVVVNPNFFALVGWNVRRVDHEQVLRFYKVLVDVLLGALESDQGVTDPGDVDLLPSLNHHGRACPAQQHVGAHFILIPVAESLGKCLPRPLLF